MDISIEYMGRNHTSTDTLADAVVSNKNSSLTRLSKGTSYTIKENIKAGRDWFNGLNELDEDLENHILTLSEPLRLGKYLFYSRSEFETVMSKDFNRNVKYVNNVVEAELRQCSNLEVALTEAFNKVYKSYLAQVKYNKERKVPKRNTSFGRFIPSH